MNLYLYRSNRGLFLSDLGLVLGNRLLTSSRLVGLLASLCLGFFMSLIVSTLLLSDEAALVYFCWKS